MFSSDAPLHAVSICPSIHSIQTQISICGLCHINDCLKLETSKGDNCLVRKDDISKEILRNDNRCCFCYINDCLKLETSKVGCVQLVQQQTSDAGQQRALFLIRNTGMKPKTHFNFSQIYASPKN